MVGGARRGGAAAGQGRAARKRRGAAAAVASDAHRKKDFGARCAFRRVDVGVTFAMLLQGGRGGGQRCKGEGAGGS